MDKNVTFMKYGTLSALKRFCHYLSWYVTIKFSLLLLDSFKIWEWRNYGDPPSRRGSPFVQVDGYIDMPFCIKTKVFNVVETVKAPFLRRL